MQSEAEEPNPLWRRARSERWDIGPYLIQPQGDWDIDETLYQNALIFLITCAPSVSDRSYAEIYLLRNNCLKIYNRAGAAYLAQRSGQLSAADKPISVRSLQVYADLGDDYIGPGMRHIDAGDAPLDPAHYDADDQRRIGVRACRILKQILDVPRLQHLSIRMCNPDRGRNNMHKWKLGLPMFAAIVARLKEKVSATASATTSRDSIFYVSFEVASRFSNINFKQSDYDENITHLWNAPDPQKEGRWDAYSRNQQEVDALSEEKISLKHLLIWRALCPKDIVRSPDSTFVSRHQEELELKRSTPNTLHFSDQQFNMEEYHALDTCAVAKLAADPDWEEKAEVFAKTPDPTQQAP